MSAPKKAPPQKRSAPTVAPVEAGKQSSEGTSLVAPSYPKGDGPGSRADAVRKTREKDRIKRQALAEAKRQAMFRPTTSDQLARLQALRKVQRGSDNDSQEIRFAAALQGGSVTTHEARQLLDIPSPAPRIFSLRRQGYVIRTSFVVQVSSCGVRHRYARYTLMHIPVEGV